MRTRVLVSIVMATGMILLSGACAREAAPRPAAEAAPTSAAPPAAAQPPVAAPGPAATPVPEGLSLVNIAPQVIDDYVKQQGVSLSLPQPPEDYAPKYGGKIELAQYRQTFMDLLYSGFQDREASFIADTLVFFDLGPGTNPNDYTPRPVMAESWELKDGGTTYLFHLRKGVKFKNQPNTNVDETRDATAQDWVDMYQFVYGEPTSRFKSRFPEIAGPESWRAIDDYTLEAKTSYPSAPFLYKLAVRGPGLYNVEPIKERMESEQLPAAEAAQGWEMWVSTGPWVLKNFTQDVSTQFEKNPNYWGTDDAGNQLPFIDEVEVFKILDERAQDAAFRTGRLAANAIDTCGLSTERYQDLARSNPDTVWEIFVDSTNQRATLLDMRNPIFQDIRVRRAMQLSVDKEGWVKSVLGGWGLPWATPLAPGNQWWLPPTAEGYPDVDGDGIPGVKYLDFDLPMAQELMTQAGYSPQNPIKARYLLTHDLGNRFFSEAELQIESFRNIGFDITIEIKDGAARRAAEESTDWDMLYRFPGYGWDPSDWFFQGYHSQATKQLYGPGGLQDPELEKLIEEEEATIDPIKRYEKVAYIQRYLQEKQYYIMGAQWIQIVAIAPWLKNYQYHYVTPIGQAFALAWIEEE
jgi:ABC-type transport system substrate-binding protein